MYELMSLKNEHSHNCTQGIHHSKGCTIAQSTLVSLEESRCCRYLSCQVVISRVRDGRLDEEYTAAVRGLQ